MHWNDKKRQAMIEYSNIIREASVQDYSDAKFAARISGWARRNNIPTNRIYIIHSRVIRSIK